MASTRSLSITRASSPARVCGVNIQHGSQANPAPAIAASAIAGAKRLSGIFVGSRKMFEDLNRVVSVAGIHPVVDRTFGFDRVREAYEHLASGNHLGKVVIRIT